MEMWNKYASLSQGRLDVLVHAKEVVRVILSLQLGKALVVRAVAGGPSSMVTRSGIDPRGLHLREVDDQPVVAHGIAGDVVPAAANGEQEPAVTGKVHAAYHVRGGGAAGGDRGRRCDRVCQLEREKGLQLMAAGPFPGRQNVDSYSTSAPTCIGAYPALSGKFSVVGIGL